MARTKQTPFKRIYATAPPPPTSPVVVSSSWAVRLASASGKGPFSHSYPLPGITPDLPARLEAEGISLASHNPIVRAARNLTIQNCATGFDIAVALMQYKLTPLQIQAIQRMISPEQNIPFHTGLAFSAGIATMPPPPVMQHPNNARVGFDVPNLMGNIAPSFLIGGPTAHLISMPPVTAPVAPAAPPITVSAPPAQGSLLAGLDLSGMAGMVGAFPMGYLPTGPSAPVPATDPSTPPATAVGGYYVGGGLAGAPVPVGTGVVKGIGVYPPANAGLSSALGGTAIGITKAGGVTSLPMTLWQKFLHFFGFSK